MCTADRPDMDSASDDGGDVWGAGSSDGDGAGSAHGELEREWNSRQNQFYTAGYREGLDEGKEETLQQGFNVGFREGAEIGFEWGLLRGALKTLEVLAGQVSGTTEMRDQVRELSAKVEAVPPRDARLSIFKQVLSRPMPAGQQPGATAAAENAEVAAGSRGGEEVASGTAATAAAVGEAADALQGLGLHQDAAAQSGAGAVSHGGEGSASATVAPRRVAAVAPPAAAPGGDYMGVDMEGMIADLRRALQQLGYDPGAGPSAPPTAAAPQGVA